MSGRPRDSERGQATVEFALIFPVLILIVAGIIQFGLTFNFWITLNHDAGSGARWVAVDSLPNVTGSPTIPEYKQYIYDQILGAGLRNEVRPVPADLSNIKICYTPAVTSTASGPQVGDAVTVSLTAPDHKIKIPFLAAGIPAALTGKATMRIEQAPSNPDTYGPCTPDQMLGPTRQRALADERGAVLVLMTVALPVMFLLLAMAMDFGNWYIHTSQLQTRADAAALAAGLEYTSRFKDCPSSNERDRERRQAVRGYRAPPPHSTPGSTATWEWRCTTPPAPTPHPDGSSGYWTDVNVKDHVTSFFSGFGVINPTFHATARVKLDGGEHRERHPALRRRALCSSDLQGLQRSPILATTRIPLTESGDEWTAVPHARDLRAIDLPLRGIKVGCDRSLSDLRRSLRGPSRAGRSPSMG